MGLSYACHTGGNCAWVALRGLDTPLAFSEPDCDKFIFLRVRVRSLRRKMRVMPLTPFCFNLVTILSILFDIEAVFLFPLRG